VKHAPNGSAKENKVNILLVDDRRENLLALEGILRVLDENLIQATSGVEALKFLLRNDAR
jgi:CheY-like chemotaxis protein